MKMRVVPMTKRLREILTAHRHLRGDRVLYTDAGETVTAKVLQKWMKKAQKRAGLKDTGGIHILRHTFCSHLAMKGAPALSIQKLAGHEDLQTTLGYMHLAHGETDRAIRLLEEPHGRVNTASMAEVAGGK
jgi:site-specific recombinase XerD